MSDFPVEFLQSQIDNARRELDAMNAGVEHPQIRSALAALGMAQSLLDQNMGSADGRTYKALRFAFSAHINNAIRAMHAIDEEGRNKKRQAGLDHLNQSKQSAKSAAQDKALKLWSEDTEQRIRIGEMCQTVWADMHEDFGECLPDSANGMKPWLREVAPDYAKKGGRPKQ